MDMIWNELRRNIIEIDIETLSFYINTCSREHEEIDETVINRIGRDYLPMNLSHIYTEMNPNNFGRLMAYLAIVYKIADPYEEIVREAL